jgi:hypothetical protein
MHGRQLRGMAWQGSNLGSRDPKPPAPGSCRGRYYTDRQPGAALQNTAMCPAGPPPARSLTAWTGGQSHNVQDTVIRPGPRTYPGAIGTCGTWRREGSRQDRFWPVCRRVRVGREAEDLIEDLLS